jgi:hypothetical protein
MKIIPAVYGAMCALGGEVRGQQADVCDLISNTEQAQQRPERLALAWESIRHDKRYLQTPLQHCHLLISTPIALSGVKLLVAVCWTLCN